jgi:hypothetical protein
LPQERLEPRRFAQAAKRVEVVQRVESRECLIRRAAYPFPAYRVLFQPEHLGTLAMPHQLVIPLVCPSVPVEVFRRRVCLCLCLFRTAQVKSLGRRQPLGWRQRPLVESSPASPYLCLCLFQMV